MSVTTLDRTMESVRQVADVSVEGTNGVSFTLGGAIFGDIIAAEGDTPPPIVPTWPDGSTWKASNSLIFLPCRAARLATMAAPKLAS